MRAVATRDIREVDRFSAAEFSAPDDAGLALRATSAGALPYCVVQ